ncbi:hypothetical protein KEM56_003007 [Ascosphaera pollenicola]|nr:hypothetical protein KEM56_003007 [Ascosphaera pollenicola]
MPRQAPYLYILPDAADRTASSTTTTTTSTTIIKQIPESHREQQQPDMPPPQQGRRPYPHASNRRAKSFNARTLAIQSSDAALSKTGELDVSAYLAARAFEIRALEKGILDSKHVNSQRAFQKVPRDYGGAPQAMTSQRVTAFQG